MVPLNVPMIAVLYASPQSNGVFDCGDGRGSVPVRDHLKALSWEMDEHEASLEQVPGKDYDKEDSFSFMSCSYTPREITKP